MQTAARRVLVSLGALAAIVLGGATACGLLAPPGGYSGAEETAVDGSVDVAPSPDGGGVPDVVVLPDGNTVPASAGTIVVAAGERDPTSPADNPAWSGDVWSGLLDATGHVASWRVEKSTPIVGPFDTSTIVSGKWLTLSFGLGIGGGRGSALQSVAWSPGPSGDWAAAAAGMPGGLDDLSRAFFGAHVITVGGVRYQQVDGGTVTSWTKEVHVADVDVGTGTLGAFGDPGVSLVEERSRAGVVVASGYVYVVGGRSPNGVVTASVERAKVDPGTGAVQAFAQQPALKNAGQDHKVAEAAVASSDAYLFVAGGRNAANAPVDVVLAAKIDADGVLLDFKNVTTLPKPLFDLALVAHKGTLYAIGGQGAQGRSSSVYSARVAADGTLGPWEETPNAPLPGKRSDLTAVVY